MPGSWPTTMRSPPHWSRCGIEESREHLREQRSRKVRWPDPYVSLNPGFEGGGTIKELVDAGLLDEECERLFRVKTGPEDPGEHSISLHRHQREAIEAARTGRSYVVTTGTGSGKSLTYLIPIVNAVLTEPARGRIKAIVVYPMNALANSQWIVLDRLKAIKLPSGHYRVRRSEVDRILRDQDDDG